MPAAMPRSVHQTSLCQSSTSAATKPTNGSTTPTTLEILWVRVTRSPLYRTARERALLGSLPSGGGKADEGNRIARRGGRDCRCRGGPGRREAPRASNRPRPGAARRLPAAELLKPDARQLAPLGLREPQPDAP